MAVPSPGGLTGLGWPGDPDLRPRYHPGPRVRGSGAWWLYHAPFPLLGDTGVTDDSGHTEVGWASRCLPAQWLFR